MRRRLSHAAIPTIALTAAMLGAAPAQALVINYFSDLTQANEVPASTPTTGATGVATFVYDDQGDGFGVNDTLSWVINYTADLFPGGISSAHLHIGHSAANGDIIIDIPSHSGGTPANGLSPPPIIGSTILSALILGSGTVAPPAMCGGVADPPDFLYSSSAIRTNFRCEDGTATVLDTTDPANNGKAVNIYINLHTSDTALGFIRDQLNLVIAAPEPATLALFGFSLIGLAALGRRRSA